MPRGSSRSLTGCCCAATKTARRPLRRRHPTRPAQGRARTHREPTRAHRSATGHHRRQLEEARKILADTLDLARDCHAAYLEANDSTRRLFNQAFFSKIYIDEDPETRERSIRVDYNEPFGELLSRLVPARVHHELQTQSRAENRTPRPDNRAGGHEFGSDASEGQGCPPDTLVEVPGIEPGSSGGSTGLLRVQLTRKSQSPTLASSCSGTQPLNLSMLTPLAKVSYQAF
jgi:hypothetical protein